MELILNNSELEITDYTSNSFLAEMETYHEATLGFETLLASDGSVTVKDGEETVMTAENLTYESVQVTVSQNGYLAVYYYHGAKAMTAEDEYSQVGKILMGVEA